MTTNVQVQTYQAHYTNFYNTELISVQLPDGKIVVPLRPICEAIGLAFNSQFTKVKNDPAFNCYDIITVGKDGKQREMFCLELDELHAWFFTINPNKLKSEIQPQFILFKKECIRALRDYWRMGIAVNPRLMNESDERIDYIVKKAFAAAREEAERFDPQAKFRRDIASYREVADRWPQLDNWAATCITVSNDWYQGNVKPDTSMDAFALSDIFVTMGFNQREALKHAMRLGKLNEVKKFSRGKKRSEVNGNIREVNYYIRADFDSLMKIALEWAEEKQLIETSV